MSQKSPDVQQESDKNETERAEEEESKIETNHSEGAQNEEGSSGRKNEEMGDGREKEGESNDDESSSEGRESGEEDRESNDDDDSEERETGDEDRDCDDEESESVDDDVKSDGVENENSDVEGRAVAKEERAETQAQIPDAKNGEDHVPSVRSRPRMENYSTHSEEHLGMSSGPRSLFSSLPEDDILSGQHQRRHPRRRRYNEFTDDSYYGYQSIDYEQYQTLSPQFLVNVLIKSPNYRSGLLYFVEKFNFHPSHIRQVVSKNSHVFGLDQEAIILQPKIGLCTSHFSLTGCQHRLQCGDIHMCPRFIGSHCNDEHCLFGHKFRTSHNLRNLSDYYLDHLSSSNLKQFFHSNAGISGTQEVIKVCKDYNRDNCKQENCSGLHICKDYIINRLACRNRQCQLNHNLLSSDCCWLLRRYGIDTNETPRDIYSMLLEVNPAIGDPENSNEQDSGTNPVHQTSDETSRQNSVTDIHSDRSDQSDNGSTSEAVFVSVNESSSSLSSSPAPVSVTSGTAQSTGNNANNTFSLTAAVVSTSATVISDSRIQDPSIPARNTEHSETNTASNSVISSHTSTTSVNVNVSPVVDSQVSNNVSRDSSTVELKVNMPSLWSHHLEGDVRVAEICYDSVVGTCPREHHSCPRLHSKKHFHWQVSEENDSWLNLLPYQVMCLEHSFCNPGLDSVALPPLNENQLDSSMSFLLLLMGEDIWVANFQGMVLLNSDETRMLYLRRLCTEIIPGITTDPSTYHWFYCDADSVWNEYGEANGNGDTGYINSEVLECQHMINPNGYAQFTIADSEYMLDFSTMTQTNMSTQEVLQVRRRPKPHFSESDTNEVLDLLGLQVSNNSDEDS